MKRMILLAMMATLGACGGGGSSSESASSSGAASTPLTSSTQGDAPARAYTQSDQEIAELVYAGTPRTPADFYSEEMPAGASYVSTVHLKNTDVAPASADATVYEACTDDWNAALDWSEAAAQRMPSYGDLAQTNTDDRFFEFVRVPRSAPTALMRQRVFRCSYVDRSGTDAQALNGAGGRLNQRPLTAVEVKRFAEYLWQFSTFNNFGSAVLASTTQQGTTFIEHDLTIATLERAASAAECDRIRIVRWSHAVDTSTGDITRTLTNVAVLQARESNGSVTLCGAP
jgi:hypothetical protein